MTIEIKEPSSKAPWPPLASNDKSNRYPKPYPVGKEKGESFFTIARKHRLAPADLVWYNFQTKEAKEINWYLKNYLGCPEPLHGHKNYELFGCVYDEAKSRGVVFVPRHGKPNKNYVNRVGEKLVEHYDGSANKTPGGACFSTTFDRYKDAAKAVGVAIPRWKNNSKFSAIWGSLVHQPAWQEVEEEYKGLGAAGAIVSEGLGTLVDTDGVWRGALEPGAVIQVWNFSDAVEKVKKGEEAAGHSFVFLNYVYEGSSITGMVIADQGYQSDAPLKKSDYAIWYGANLYQLP